MNNRLSEAMETAVADGIFPSGSLLVAKSGTITHDSHHGNASPSTIYDVASLTKAFATTTLTMMAVDEKKLSPSDPLSRFFPNIPASHAAITMANLLTHSSGLPAWKPFYRDIPVSMIGKREAYQHIVNEIIVEPLDYAIGTKSVYSDLGFILLGHILEVIYDTPLNELFDSRIAKPLDLTDSFYSPLSADVPSHRSFLPTEDCAWRQMVVQGRVHDQNGFAMGGVAGHAGLFSTTANLHRLTSALVTTYRGTNSLISPSTIHTFWSDAYRPAGSTWRLGWDTPSRPVSSTGHHTSANTIGHLGYTGCSITIDLDQDYWMILLTNRIHPTTTNEKIRQFRPYIHDLVWEEVMK